MLLAEEVEEDDLVDRLVAGGPQGGADGGEHDVQVALDALVPQFCSGEVENEVVAAFDAGRSSFRTEQYAEYKGTRGDTPPEFIGQVPLLEEALAAMNIPTITKEDYEADDILATLAMRGAQEGYRVLVVSGDRDSIQLVNDDVTLLYPNARGVSELKRYDYDAVVERYGIEVRSWPLGGAHPWAAEPGTGRRRWPIGGERR